METSEEDSSTEKHEARPSSYVEVVSIGVELDGGSSSSWLEGRDSSRGLWELTMTPVLGEVVGEEADKEGEDAGIKGVMLPSGFRWRSS